MELLFGKVYRKALNRAAVRAGRSTAPAQAVVAKA